jgi:hypothetical protein
MKKTAFGRFFVVLICPTAHPVKQRSAAALWARCMKANILFGLRKLAYSDFGADAKATEAQR